ncbi:hypothetical protein [Sulfurimonas sp.]|uniref:hypothetical protein n=1 Tax=Sulfurimonas sp. TaxID=2022749 RepID=UPI0026253FED|nr:hypothetical protein [Sulfurimonas sp.]
MIKFLYISTTGRLERPYLDPSVRYRCYNPAEDLETLGHLADVVSFHDFQIAMIKNYDVFIFHRPPYDEKLEIALAVMDRYKKQYYADYDDLIFAPEYALQSSLYKTGRADKKKTLKIFKNNFKAMKLFKNFTVSTTPLKDVILHLNRKANVKVIHNGLSQSWLNRANLNFVPNTSSFKTMSYLSGTKSHDHDFEIVENIMAKQLASKKDLHLMLVGPLEFNKDLLNDKVRHLRYVEYQNLPQLITKSWLNIAPLEDNIFNKCKSGLKFFESAILGIPSIVSSLPDFERFDDAVFIAKDEEKWNYYIDKLYNDEEFYKKKSLEVKQYAQEKCMSLHQTNKFINIVEEI